MYIKHLNFLSESVDVVHHKAVKHIFNMFKADEAKNLIILC